MPFGANNGNPGPTSSEVTNKPISLPKRRCDRDSASSFFFINESNFSAVSNPTTYTLVNWVLFALFFQYTLDWLNTFKALTLSKLTKGSLYKGTTFIPSTL